jgi:DNA polymerase-1
MIYTFLKSLMRLIREQEPLLTEIAWESPRTIQWRREILPTYKPSNPLKQDYLEQLKDLQKVINNLGIKQYYSPTNEADDVIAMLVGNAHTVIFTVDKDMYQLVDDSIPIEILSKNKLVKENDVVDKFGIRPTHIPLYLAMVGDKSDNIPGIRGIGPRKARDYINRNLVQELPREQQILIRKYTKLTMLNKNGELKELVTGPANAESILRKYQLKKLDLTIPKVQRSLL